MDLEYIDNWSLWLDLPPRRIFWIRYFSRRFLLCERKETGERRKETGDRRKEKGDRRQETGKQETGDWRKETGNR